MITTIERWQEEGILWRADDGGSGIVRMPNMLAERIVLLWQDEPRKISEQSALNKRAARCADKAIRGLAQAFLETGLGVADSRSAAEQIVTSILDSAKASADELWAA